MKLTRTFAFVAALTLVGAGGLMAQQTPRPRAPRTPHATAGKEECLTCHGPAAREHVTSIPEGHNYENRRCLGCHRLTATLPPSSQHESDARHARCAACHREGGPAGAKPTPASHASYDASLCSLCHASAPAGP